MFLFIHLDKIINGYQLFKPISKAFVMTKKTFPCKEKFAEH